MKIKSMIAALAASAIAVSTMAVSASAALFSKTGNGQEKYNVDIKDIDASKIDKIVAEVTCDTEYLKGTFGFNDTSNNDKWASHGETEDSDGNHFFESKVNAGEALTATWELSGIEGKVAAQDVIEIQFWWINPHYNADGSEGDKGTATIESVKLLDKDGNELTAKAAETTTEAPATTTAADTTKAGTTTTAAKSATKTDSTKTGDAGVGIVVAAMGLAAAVAFASRKKH